MEDKLCFVAVEFEHEFIFAGRFYWYLCRFKDVCEGDKVLAPFGKNNLLQEGTVKLVYFSGLENAPFPLNSIKCIREVKEREE